LKTKKSVISVINETEFKPEPDQPFPIKNAGLNGPVGGADGWRLADSYCYS
jgi:hypothetical protein